MELVQLFPGIRARCAKPYTAMRTLCGHGPATPGQQLYGVPPGPLAHGHRTRPSHPGPLVRAYDGMGGVATPIVFGYQAEASEGACDLIKSLAEAWAPDLAERYVIDSAEAAVGIATDLLREEFGAAVFTAQATVLLDRIKYCMRGQEAAARRPDTNQPPRCLRAVGHPSPPHPVHVAYGCWG